MTKLNRDEKGQVVAEVVDRLERTETVMAADFRGLTVAEIAQLRDRLREVEAEMTVVKNTLSRRAADQTGRTALLQYLTGPTGLVWVDGDPARAAKALSEFQKAHQEVFTIRGGVLGAEDLPAGSIIRLASLPSREQMLAQLAGAIASPLTGLAGRMNGFLSALARTLAAVQGSGALAPGEAPAAPAPAAAEEAPAAEASDDETPAEAPADESPADEAPADEAPAEAEADEPVAEAPGEDAPAVEADEAPAAEVEMEEAPADGDAPADDASENPEN